MPDDPLIPGRATADGTARFAARFAHLPDHFRRPDRLSFSSIGLGTRQGSPSRDDVAYRGAILRALALGVNVFDTAHAYRMQTSERALGSALRRAFAQKLAARDELVVVSKCGYIAADAASTQEPRSYLVRTYLSSGLVDEIDLVNGMHVMTPEFVAHELERSRRNLGLETIDLYLFEDPELQLLARGPTIFKDMLRRLFEAFEAAVTRGAIAAYGLSTQSGLLVPYGEKGHLSVLEIFETAIEIGGPDHHMRALSLPYSVAYGEAQGLDSQFGPEGSAAGALETLRDTGTAVLAAAPLVHGQAVRGLPLFFRQVFPQLETDAQRCIQFARSTPGVTTTLVGMRSAAHVEENLAVAAVPPAQPEAIERLFQAAAKRESRKG